MWKAAALAVLMVHCRHCRSRPTSSSDDEGNKSAAIIQAAHFAEPLIAIPNSPDEDRALANAIALYGAARARMISATSSDFWTTSSV